MTKKWIYRVLYQMGIISGRRFYAAVPGSCPSERAVVLKSKFQTILHCHFEQGHTGEHNAWTMYPPFLHVTWHKSNTP